MSVRRPDSRSCKSREHARCGENTVICPSLIPESDRAVWISSVMSMKSGADAVALVHSVRCVLTLCVLRRSCGSGASKDKARCVQSVEHLWGRCEQPAHTRECFALHGLCAARALTAPTRQTMIAQVPSSQASARCRVCPLGGRAAKREGMRRSVRRSSFRGCSAGVVGTARFAGPLLRLERSGASPAAHGVAGRAVARDLRDPSGPRTTPAGRFAGRRGGPEGHSGPFPLCSLPV